MIYWTGRLLLRVFFFLVYRLEAVGLENIPQKGSVILCGNHTSNLDPPLLGTPLDRKVYYMAKEELFKVPILGWLIKQCGAFPVKRGGVSRDSIRRAVHILEAGNVMGVFPEGSRKNAGGPAQKGAASLAIKTQAQVIPTTIIGSYVPFRKMKIIYGKPLDLSAYADGSSHSLEQATDLIMKTIRAELPKHK